MVCHWDLCLELHDNTAGWTDAKRQKSQVSPDGISSVIPLEVLARVPLFAGAPADVIASVAKRAVDERVAADDVLFRAGSAARGWFIVIEGNVRVVTGVGARQHVIHTEGPGGTLGEVPLFTDSTYPATAIASEPTRCALLDRRALEEAMQESPALGFILARRLALRVAGLVSRLNDRSARSVKSRLIAFLLDRHAVLKKPVISMGMTQQRAAEEIGTVREVLVRELQALARAGLIESRGGGRYEILSVDGLRSLLVSDP
jgi:CRP/FNR family transcriptional regulator, dissimilatory nitrate respiration regulator